MDRPESVSTRRALCVGEALNRAQSSRPVMATPSVHVANAGKE
jgi:hypothetical protein